MTYSFRSWRSYALTLILLIFISLSLALSNLTAIHIHAATPTIIDHDIVEDTVWTIDRSPYRIVKDIEIKADLEIEPGVVVEIGGNVKIYITGSLIAKGTPKHPITFILLNPRAYWILYIERGYAGFENVVFRGLIAIHSNQGGIEIRNFIATNISFNAKNSYVLLDNGELSSLLFYPSYSSSPYLDSEPSIYNSTVIIRNIFVKNYIAGIATYPETQYNLGDNGFDFPVTDIFMPFFVRTRLVIENLTCMIGLAFNSYNSTISFENLVTREILSYSLIDTNITITNSVIAWGRGIYIYEIHSLNTLSSIIMRNTAIYNTYLSFKGTTLILQSIGIRIELTDSNVVIDLRYNWWGDSSGPRHSDLNPEGKGVEIQIGGAAQLFFYPWLEKPHIPFPSTNISIDIVPPIPIEDLRSIIRVEPSLDNAYYLFIVESPSLSYPQKALAISTPENKISLVFNIGNPLYKYNRLATVVVYYRGVLLGTMKNLLILPNLKTEIHILKPTEEYTKSNNISFVIS
ncbi:MAG TPA: hypothetical protein ENF93_00375, partial [Ignisphaera sp.]|nr:hypothetical protein [Ignisphaera sp.]